MKIEHVAIYVKDLEGAKNFFIKYFAAKSNNLYHNMRTVATYESCIIGFENNEFEFTE